jgi:hypothetical protein
MPEYQKLGNMWNNAYKEREKNSKRKMSNIWTNVFKRGTEKNKNRLLEDEELEELEELEDKLYNFIIKYNLIM